LPICIQRIPFNDIPQNFFVRHLRGRSFFLEFQKTSSGPFLGSGYQKKLEGSLGKHHGSHITSLGDKTGFSSLSTLKLHKMFPYGRERCVQRNPLGNPGKTYFSGHILSKKKNPFFSYKKIHGLHKVFDFLGFSRFNGLLHKIKRHCPIHGPCIEERKMEPLGYPFGNGTLSGSRRAIDSDNKH